VAAIAAEVIGGADRDHFSDRRNRMRGQLVGVAGPKYDDGARVKGRQQASQ